MATFHLTLSQREHGKHATMVFSSDKIPDIAQFHADLVGHGFLIGEEIKFGFDRATGEKWSRSYPVIVSTAHIVRVGEYHEPRAKVEEDA